MEDVNERLFGGFYVKMVTVLARGVKIDQKGVCRHTCMQCYLRSFLLVIKK